MMLPLMYTAGRDDPKNVCRRKAPKRVTFGFVCPNKTLRENLQLLHLFNWIGVVSHFWLRFPAVSCRQMLGIHYRFDGQEGLTLGETIAVRLLHQVNRDMPTDATHTLWWR